MPDTNEQQEAVCGTCGERLIWSAITQTWRHAVYPGHMPDVRTATIPAPVVPSDDDDWCGCGHHVEAHGTSRYCYECPRDEDGTALHEFKPRKPAPPTLSQDAEGDGRRPKCQLCEKHHGPDGRTDIARAWNAVVDHRRTAEHAVFSALCSDVESSIRADYEELVKTAIREQFRCRRCKGTTEPQCVSCYDYQQCVCRPGEGSNADKCWACVDGVEQAGQRLLTRIEELQQ